MIPSIVLYQQFKDNGDDALQILLIVSLSIYLFGFCFIFFIVDQETLQKAQDKDVDKLIGKLSQTGEYCCSEKTCPCQKRDR